MSLSSVPRYTIKSLCKCLASNVIPLFIHVWEVMALIYMLWVGAVKMEMSKISPNAMGITSAFFIHDCRNLCCFSKQDRKKTPKIKTSGTGNHHLKPKPCRSCSVWAQWHIEGLDSGGVSCVRVRQPRWKQEKHLQRDPEQEQTQGFVGLLASWKEAWNSE